MKNAADRYQSIRAETSSPGEILLALYSGLFRFLKGARTSIEQGDRQAASKLLNRAHAIISELYIALDRESAPELCEQLAGVYDFCMDRVARANASGDIALVDEVVRVMTPLKEAWEVAVPQTHGERQA